MRQVWQADHDRKAADDQSNYRVWLRVDTREGGSPSLARVGLMNGAKVRDLYDNGPSAEYAQLAFFRACHREAASVHSQEQADAKRRRDRQEKLERERGRLRGPLNRRGSDS